MVRAILIILGLYASQLSAQDLILKRSGEKIYCNIEEVTDFFIHFYELEDIEKSLLYKMDVAIVDKISFGSSLSETETKKSYSDKKKEFEGSLNSVETNVDGLLNKYFSLHYHYVSTKYTFDLGFKRFSGRISGISFFTQEDNGSMVETGISIPMKMFGTESNPYRGIYLRGFGIYTRGTFRSDFQDFIIQKYTQATFGAQGVLSYQLNSNLYFKLYYGLGGTVEINNFGPRTKQADISAPGGIQTISGLRVGYIF